MIEEYSVSQTHVILELFSPALVWTPVWEGPFGTVLTAISEKNTQRK